jgi:hypothetical protein
MYRATQCVPGRSSGSVFPIKAEGTFNLLGSLFLAYIPLKTFLVLGCVFGFREKIMPKETPCLDLISHPTCLKLEPFSS